MASNLKKSFAGLSKLMGVFLPVRVISLLCSIYVTRALLPEEFTIVAVAMAVYSLTERLTAMNLISHLVRAKEVTDKSLEVAFTYELVRGATLGSIVLIAGFILTMNSSDPRPGQATVALSSVFIINGLRNPQLVHLRRKGEFFKYGLTEFGTLLAFGLSSVIAVKITASYHALVFSTIFSNLFGVTMGYLIAPWRPRFNFDFQEALPMIKLGMVLLAGSLMNFIKDQCPIWVILLLAGATGGELGYFNRASSFSWILGVQMVAMLWRVLLPQYSALSNKGKTLLSSLNKMQFILLLGFLVMAPISYFVGPDLLLWALGEKWMPMKGLWTWLALAAGLAIVSAPAECIMQATYREKTAVKLYIMILCVHCPLVITGYFWLGLTGIGLAYLVSQLLQLVVFRFTAKNIVNKF